MANIYKQKNQSQLSRHICALPSGRSISLWSLAVLLMVVFFAAAQPATDPIVLKAEPLNLTPKEFYIADIIDERENRKAVAWLLPVSDTNTSGASQPVDLQGGGLVAIKQFVKQSLPRNTKLRPVIIRLSECKISEEPGTEGRVDGRVQVAMSFELQRDGELIPLTDYEGAVRYSRSAKQQTVVEPALRRSLSSALKYLNEWMESEAKRSEKLAMGVKVFFTDYTQNVSEDTVFYDPQRPLAWSDFKGKPRPGKYAASIMPSFSYGGPSEVVDGYIHLNLSMKVFALRENCWASAAALNEYGLNHEQRHFDIMKIIAERFKRKIQGMTLGVDDYSGIIAYEYIETFREMNKMQDQYDSETSHSTNHAAQGRWNHTIDAELNLLGVKK